MEQKQKNPSYRRGIRNGIVGGILGTVLVGCTVFGAATSMGYVHLGTQGNIYVQDTATTSSSGIGSDVESKLNTLDSALDGFYFGDVDETTAEDDIYKAYVNAYGDKYTVYYTPDEYKAVQASTNGTFTGIGATCTQSSDGGVLILEPYEEAPAYQAGIRKGDRVIAVDGTDVTAMDLQTAVAMMRGDEGTTVTLTVVRGSETLEFTITRAVVDIRTVSEKMLDNNTGYIYVSQFDSNTKDQFKNALEDLQNQGMTALVIDIRDNPGGLVSTAVDMLDDLLPSELYVYMQDKNGKKTEYSGKDADQVTVPMAVLVNGARASASESFSGAMQDYGAARIIGTQTYGKGIVQEIRPLTDGSAIKYTIAKYYTPKGQDINGKGITPDQVVELPDDATEDLQLNAALEYLNSQR